MLMKGIKALRKKWGKNQTPRDLRPVQFWGGGVQRGVAVRRLLAIAQVKRGEILFR